MDDFGTVLLILFGGNPLRSEGAERGKGGSTSPYGVVSILWSNDVDLAVLRSKLGDFLLDSLGKTLVQGGSSRADNILKQLFSEINIGLLDCLPGESVHTKGL